MDYDRKCQILFSFNTKQSRSDCQMTAAAYRKILCQSLYDSQH